MKEYIDQLQLNELNAAQQLTLARSMDDWTTVIRVLYNFEVNIGKMLQVLRKQKHVQLYSVNDNWVVQLFDLKVCPNDVDCSCIWEYSNKELCDVLWEAVKVVLL